MNTTSEKYNLDPSTYDFPSCNNMSVPGGDYTSNVTKGVVKTYYIKTGPRK